MLLYRLEDYQKTKIPLAVWLESPSRLYQKKHIHDCFEIVLVCKGTGWCAIDGQRFPMLHQDLYVLRPGSLHEFTNRSGMLFYNVMFSPRLLTKTEKETFRPLLEKSGKYTLPGTVYDRLNSLLSDLTSELQFSRPGQSLAVKARFLCFLIELLRNLRMDEWGQKRQNPLTDASLLDVIARRCREKLTLDDLARVTGGSPEYAGRLFKQLTGVTFTNYLARMRIDIACGELKNSASSITEIAAGLGYYDIAYFDKCFRRIIGVSPKTYREGMRRKSSARGRITASSVSSAD